MKALLTRQGIPFERAEASAKSFPGVTLVGVRFDYEPFTKGRVGFFPVYINTQGVDLRAELKAAGEGVGFLSSEAYGVRFVANSIVTSARTAREEAKTVEHFVRAALRGWHDVLDSARQRDVIRAVTTWPGSVDTDARLTAEKVEITRRLIQTPAGKPLGYLDTEGWKQTEEVMLSSRLIARSVHVEDSLIPMYK